MYDNCRKQSRIVRKTTAIPIDTNQFLNCIDEPKHESPYLDGILKTSNKNKEDKIIKYFLDINNCNSLRIVQKTCTSSSQIFKKESLNPKSVKLEDNLTINLEPTYNDLGNKSVLCKKNKKNKNIVTICTTNSRFDVVRKIAMRLGLKEVGETDVWDIIWTDINMPVSRAKEMKRFQKINHFPGMNEISRKDLLAKNLNRMQKSFPKDYDFFPKTWCLPSDFNDVLHYSKMHKNKIFIMKPESGSQGRGIFLTKNLKEVEKSEKLICQLYISKPFLIDGYKFDIRVYSLITSCDPLRIYVYNEGLARFATIRYADPNVFNCANIFMHLTNYAVNKMNSTHVYNPESGIKRKISTLNRLLEPKGVDIKHLWKNVDQAIVKTIISAWPVLKHNYHSCFSSHDTIQACFEILGFDILLDQNANPYILEVNQSPSFHTDTLIDKEIKENLIADTLTLINIWRCDKKKILEEDRRRVKERLIYGTQKQLSVNGINSPMEKDIKEKERVLLNEQIQWETEHLGNYRCVYPDEKYEKFFEQPSNTLYLSTMSSRAREECVKQQREEFEAKAKLKNLSKLPSMSQDLRGFEDPMTKTHKCKDRKKVSLPNIAKNKETVYRAFEPVPIVESEERKRLLDLAYRGALIENQGLLEKIYQMMKIVGTLKMEDEKKISNCKWFIKLKEDLKK